VHPRCSLSPKCSFQTLNGEMNLDIYDLGLIQDPPCGISA
jgi:hypothetical protein